MRAGDDTERVTLARPAEHPLHLAHATDAVRGRLGLTRSGGLVAGLRDYAAEAAPRACARS